MLVIDLVKAIRAGRQLKNSSVWADRQSLANICVTLLAFAVGASRLFGLDIPITDEQLITFGGGLAIILGTGNAVLSVATNKNAGIKIDG